MIKENAGKGRVGRLSDEGGDSDHKELDGGLRAHSVCAATSCQRFSGQGLLTVAPITMTSPRLSSPSIIASSVETIEL